MKAYLTVFAAFMLLITLQTIHYLEFQDRMKSFISKGPRFTALGGQALCERIAKLEKAPQPCSYGVSR